METMYDFLEKNQSTGKNGDAGDFGELCGEKRTAPVAPGGENQQVVHGKTLLSEKRKDQVQESALCAQYMRRRKESARRAVRRTKEEFLDGEYAADGTAPAL